MSVRDIWNKRTDEEKDHLHRLFLQTRNKLDRINYKNTRNSVKTVLMNAHKDHFLSEVKKHKTNTGSLWKIIDANVPLRQRETQVYI